MCLCFVLPRQASALHSKRHIFTVVKGQPTDHVAAACGESIGRRRQDIFCFLGKSHAVAFLLPSRKKVRLRMRYRTQRDFSSA